MGSHERYGSCATRSLIICGPNRMNLGTLVQTPCGRPTRVGRPSRGRRQLRVWASVPRFIRIPPYFVEDLAGPAEIRPLRPIGPVFTRAARGGAEVAQSAQNAESRMLVQSLTRQGAGRVSAMPDSARSQWLVSRSGTYGTRTAQFRPFKRKKGPKEGG